MWNKPPNPRSTARNIEEAVRIILGFLTSPLLIVWLLVTGKWRLLPVGLTHLFAPLAIAWVVATRRDLHLYIGSTCYKIQGRRGSRPITFGVLTHTYSERRPGRLPGWRLGRVELSMRDQYTIANERLVSRGNVTVKLFARGDETSYGHGGRPGDISSVSIGPANINIGRYDPGRRDAETALRQARLRDLAQVMSMARMPVYAPPHPGAGPPPGLTLTEYSPIQQGPGEAESHRITLHFESRPGTEEEAVRRAEHVLAYRNKQGREEMRLRVATYKLPARWLAAYDNPPLSSGLPPWALLPRAALQLDSFDAYREKSLEHRAFKEMENSHLDMALSFDSAASTLFAGLPEQVRDRVSERRGKELCLQVGNLAGRCLPDLLQEMAAAGPQLIARRFIVDGREFDGTILYWPHQQYPLSSFHLEHYSSPDVAYFVEGATYGINLDHLQELLQDLMPLNDRPDLIALYQAEHDELKRERKEQWK